MSRIHWDDAPLADMGNKTGIDPAMHLALDEAWLMAAEAGGVGIAVIPTLA